jgi:hypothetical protein
VNPLSRKCGSLDVSQYCGLSRPITGIPLPYIVLQCGSIRLKILFRLGASNLRSSGISEVAGHRVESRGLIPSRIVAVFLCDSPSLLWFSFGQSMKLGIRIGPLPTLRLHQYLLLRLLVCCLRTMAILHCRYSWVYF